MSLTCKGFDTLIVIGAFLGKEDPTRLSQLEQCLSEGKKLIYLFSMEDPYFTPKSDFFSRYEVGSEEGVLALLSKALLLHVDLPDTLKAYFEGLDEGYLSGESNLGEEEIAQIETLLQEASGIVLWLGGDIHAHPRAHNIIHLAKTIETYRDAVVFGCEEVLVSGLPEAVAALKSFDGTVVYAIQDPQEEGMLYGSVQFAVAAKLCANDRVSMEIEEKRYTCTFVQDERLKGTIALLPIADALKGYPYNVTKLVKADVQ